ncbi:hypothetical protein SAMN04487846_3435 [Microbacterium sp. cf046]|uniref:hypothetical protein n=1 Tax=Microbacterium sp. cf046 TaxID=1761803 RepID=UPI0008E4F6E4|nr:hypothetical protein [Microbacterium sp. cf046]SFS17048.1 hypothetical protein SAMN04487846_3435 [Microbacterium sp. cf046]
MLIDGKSIETWDLPSEDEAPLGQFSFAGVVGQPILLWDARAPVLDATKTLTFFAGNVNGYAPPEWVEIIATATIPLSEGEFWSVIDTLGRRTWEKTIDHAAAVLAGRGEMFAQRWEQSAALKALPLADLFRAAGVELQDQLHYIGATLGQGADAYARVLEDPTMFDGAWLADLSAQVLFLGSRALDRLAPRSQHIAVRTSFTDRHTEIIAASVAEAEAYRVSLGFPPGRREPHYRIARTLVECEDGYRERLFLFDGHGIDEGNVARVMAISDSFGGRAIAGPEFSTAAGLGDLFNDEVFEIKRRSTLAIDDYLRRYVSTPEETTQPPAQ